MQHSPKRGSSSPAAHGEPPEKRSSERGEYDFQEEDPYVPFQKPTRRDDHRRRVRTILVLILVGAMVVTYVGIVFAVIVDSISVVTGIELSGIASPIVTAAIAASLFYFPPSDK